MKTLELGYGTAKETKICDRMEKECVAKILPVSEHIAICGSATGKVYLVDLRREQGVVREYLCGGAVFALALCGSFLCVGTSGGTEFIDLRRAE